MMKSTDTTVSSPLNVPKKALKAGDGQRSKGALSHAYDFNVHCYVGHLRRVHASNQPMEVEVTNSPETMTKTMVKASNPSAVNGALYYYHSKTKMFSESINSDWFFGPGTKCSSLLKCPVYVQYHHDGIAGFHLGL